MRGHAAHAASRYRNSCAQVKPAAALAHHLACGSLVRPSSACTSRTSGLIVAAHHRQHAAKAKCARNHVLHRRVPAFMPYGTMSAWHHRIGRCYQYRDSIGICPCFLLAQYNALICAHPSKLCFWPPSGGPVRLRNDVLIMLHFIISVSIAARGVIGARNVLPFLYKAYNKCQ